MTTTRVPAANVRAGLSAPETRRTDLITIDGLLTSRRLTQPYELRKDPANGGGLTFRGHASTTEQDYPVFGGTYPGWMETIAAGAFKKTLSDGADVSFLVNHTGMSLARTKSGTMTLAEDKIGLDTVANLDPRQSAVNDLYIASERGDIDEMSFAFRVVRDEWLDDNGEESNSWEGTQRRILEINLHKGDVSAVNYGANDNTDGGFRTVELAYAELRDGKDPSPQQRDIIRGLARALGEQPEASIGQEQLQRFALSLATMGQTIETMRAEITELTKVAEPAPEPTGVRMFDGIETLAAVRAQWELRRDITAA